MKVILLDEYKVGCNIRGKKFTGLEAKHIAIYRNVKAKVWWKCSCGGVGRIWSKSSNFFTDLLYWKRGDRWGGAEGKCKFCIIGYIFWKCLWLYTFSMVMSDDFLSSGYSTLLLLWMFSPQDLEKFNWSRKFSIFSLSFCLVFFVGVANWREKNSDLCEINFQVPFVKKKKN